MFERKNLENRSFLDELRNFETDVFFDLGHPLLNRIADCFIRAAGIGAIQALSKEAYFTAIEGCNGNDGSSQKAQKLPSFRGETNQKSVEALVMKTGKETLQWGMVAGVYSGLTYGLKEARGVHDWKSSALAGALTGGALAMTLDNNSHDKIVQCVITGAALSTAANLLAGPDMDLFWDPNSSWSAPWVRQAPVYQEPPLQPYVSYGYYNNNYYASGDYNYAYYAYGQPPATYVPPPDPEMCEELQSIRADLRSILKSLRSLVENFQEQECNGASDLSVPS